MRKTGKQFGIMLSEFGNPNIVRIFQRAGNDFVIVDDEHGYFDYAQVSALVAVANGIGLPIIIRVPGVTREYITKVLDMGADGILVPMVNTAEQAKEIVRYAKYTPVGARGISTTRAHPNYGVSDLRAYLSAANQRVNVCIQIETREAVDHVGEIAAVEGIDSLFIGPNDLAGDCGLPGEVTSDEVLSAVAKVAEAAGRFGKPAGIITGNRRLIESCMKHGFTYYSVGSELVLLVKGAQSKQAELRKMADQADQ